MKRLVGLIAVVGLLASGCAAQLPVVRLYPDGSDVVWMSGRAVVERGQAGIRAAVAFDHQDGRAVGFRVEIQNDAPERLEIDPKDMRFVTCVAPSKCSAQQAVVDPEAVLLDLDERRSWQEAQASNAAAAGSALILLGATAEVGSLAAGHTGHAGGPTALAGITAEDSVAQSERRLWHLDAQRQTWSTLALRRTTLLTGHGVAGLVFVPVSTDAQTVWIDAFAGGRHFWFSFKQTVFAPPSSGEPSSHPV